MACGARHTIFCDPATWHARIAFVAETPRGCVVVKYGDSTGVSLRMRPRTVVKLVLAEEGMLAKELLYHPPVALCRRFVTEEFYDPICPDAPVRGRIVRETSISQLAGKQVVKLSACTPTNLLPGGRRRPGPAKAYLFMTPDLLGEGVVLDASPNGVKRCCTMLRRYAASR